MFAFNKADEENTAVSYQEAVEANKQLHISVSCYGGFYLCRQDTADELAPKFTACKLGILAID
jgi:hypothetical protein